MLPDTIQVKTTCPTCDEDVSLEFVGVCDNPDPDADYTHYEYQDACPKCGAALHLNAIWHTEDDEPVRNHAIPERVFVDSVEVLAE